MSRRQPTLLYKVKFAHDGHMRSEPTVNDVTASNVLLVQPIGGSTRKQHESPPEKVGRVCSFELQPPHTSCELSLTDIKNATKYQDASPTQTQSTHQPPEVDLTSFSKALTTTIFTMSLNDTTIQATKGSTVYPGVANPHPCPDADPMEANFVGPPLFARRSASHHPLATVRTNNQVPDPTTETRGAGAGENFAGGRDAARALGQLQTDKKTAGSGVVEGRPGIIESTHIGPFDERSNDGVLSA